MRFIEIPAELRTPEAKIVTLSPPPGREETIGSLEVEVTGGPDGFRYGYLVEFSDQDLVDLCVSRRLWMAQVGRGMQPVSCGPVARAVALDGDRLAGLRMHELSDYADLRVMPTSRHHSLCDELTAFPTSA